MIEPNVTQPNVTEPKLQDIRVKVADYAVANANTIILMGKTRDGSRTGRALYVAKHRGSACEESIWPYRIDGERGIVAMS